MKSFKEYLIEDAREFSYRIKIAGELDAKCQADIKQRLDKYDVVSMSTAKKTPILATPSDFPGLKNTEINIIDFTFKYPASLDEIQQQVHLCGVPTANIVVVDKKWDDSIDKDAKGQMDTEKTSEKDSLLMTTDLGAPSAEQKELSKRYATRDAAMAAEAAKDGAKFEVAGGKTPKAKTTNDLPQDNTSPFSRVSRPAKVHAGDMTINVGK
jgi:hypothetical protein